MLDYKDIIVKHFGLGMSGRQIARELGVSKSGVNDVLGAFKRCGSLDFPLPEGITNYGIAAKIYGGSPGAVGRDMTYACPDFEDIHKLLHGRKNMTLVYLWNRYMKTCEAEGRKGYQYNNLCIGAFLGTSIYCTTTVPHFGVQLYETAWSFIPLEI